MTERAQPRKRSAGSRLWAAASAVAMALWASACTAQVGTMYVWGENAEGQAGQGNTTTAYYSRPIAPTGVGGTGILQDIVTAASHEHTLAVRKDGLVVAWGCNSDSTYKNLQGQLGTGSTNMFEATPQLVKGVSGSGFLGNIVGVGTGEDHSLAITADGHLYAWGNNANGELGDGTLVNQPYPIMVKTSASTYLTGVIGVAAGTRFSVALDRYGNVWAWGKNDFGQCGTGVKSAQVLYATQVVGGATGTTNLTNCTEVRARKDHSIAVCGTNAVYWGRNQQYGDAGTGVVNADYPSPGYVLDTTGVAGTKLAGVTNVGIGTQFCLALLETGEMVTWGDGRYGQLCDGNSGASYSRPYPGYAMASAGVRLTGVSNAYAGLLFGVFSRADHTVWSWGLDRDEHTSGAYIGTLGQGTDYTPNSGVALYPLQVVGPTGGPVYLSEISRLGGGSCSPWAIMGSYEPIDHAVSADGRSHILFEGNGTSTAEVSMLTLALGGLAADGMFTFAHPTNGDYMIKMTRSTDGYFYILCTNSTTTPTYAAVIKIPENATSASQVVRSTAYSISNVRDIAAYGSGQVYFLVHDGTSTGTVQVVPVTPPVTDGDALVLGSPVTITKNTSSDVPRGFATYAPGANPYPLRVLYTTAGGDARIGLHSGVTNGTAAVWQTVAGLGAPVNMYITGDGTGNKSVVLTKAGSYNTATFSVTSITTTGTATSTSDANRQAIGVMKGQPTAMTIAPNPSNTGLTQAYEPRLLLRTSHADFHYFAGPGRTWPYRPGSARVWALSQDGSQVRYSTRPFRDLTDQSP